ncbi:hypothetical protein P8C59_005532 [Phyllachora maydis]|uniref:Lytic polysaccharide monooxygenase 9 n=1 Tax=Phyllachora maydis TaxID=1825666 RepID=A0AAD9I4X8_9PEZI|nr:hypothetical protein P8C59_005532 [Phyllachora maydis]
MAIKDLATLLVLANLVHSHMILASPKPFQNPAPDNSPLSSSGSNYPCKLTGDAASFFNGAAPQGNMYTAGQSATVSFQGSAVHGGGSCQLAITSELAPSASTPWEVIHSIEGGCPSKDGTNPSTYDFTMPASVQPGNYVFAWTWISKLAGQPEFYMNCAPIQVKAGGGTRRRSVSTSANSTQRAGDMDEFELGQRFAAVHTRDTLPPLFVANLASVNDCKVGPGVDPTYPYPGPSVERPGTGSKFTAPTGSNCFAQGVTFSGDSSSPSSASPDGGSTSPASTAGASTGQSTVLTSVTVSPSTAPDSIETAAATAGGEAPSTPVPAPPEPATSPGSPPGSSSGGLTGACSSEGMFNCPDGSSYQQCASGAWSAVRPMASGTKCKLGQSTTLWARDEVRDRRGRHWGAEYAGRE